MLSDIYATPDLSKKTSRSQTAEADTGGAEERGADEVGPEKTDAQEAAAEAPQAAQPLRAAALCLGALSVLSTAAVLVLSARYVSVTSEKDKLQTRFDSLNDNHSRLQDDCSDASGNLSQLLISYTALSQNHTRLQDEVKELKHQIDEGKFCPDGWRRFGSSYYLKSSEKRSWSESRTDCQSRGSHLVTISSLDEQEFVTKLSGNDESWIGLSTEWTASGPKYVWKWVDGSALSEPFWATEPPEPTYWQAAACCAEQGRWTRGFQNARKTWICEK